MSMARSGRRLRSQNPCVTRARVRARRRWFLGRGGSKRATLDSLPPETPASSWILVDTFNYTTHGGARIDAHSKIGGEPAGGRRGLVHYNAAGCPRRPSWDSQPQLRPSTQQGKLTRRPDRQTSKCRGQGWGDFKSRQRPLAGPFCRSQIPLPPHHLPTLSGSGEKPSQFVNGSSFELMGAVPLSVFFSSPRRRPLIRCGSPPRCPLARQERGDGGAHSQLAPAS